MNRDRHSFAALFSAMLLFSGIPAARGDLITSLSVDVTNLPGGLTQYEYRLTNESASDLSVFQFSLDISSTADLTLLSGPTGWDIIYDQGDTQIIWASQGSPTDLSPGTDAIFSLSSPLGPSFQDYLIAGINESIPQLQTNSGQIAAPGPSAVPEPSTLALLVCGTVVLGIARIRRKRQ